MSRALRHRVDARDVLDANATATRAFRGRVLGRYRRTGPNAWDDYVLVEQDGGSIEVLAGTQVQLEDAGAIVRLRRGGEVVVVAWEPAAAELAARADPRASFVALCLSEEDPTPDGSLGAWLHAELRPKPEAKD
jgi:hypothetical protein